ncbi:hypothetical protein [Burkholderia multivorans]|uniref:hypothetical protein n=1 Tax=Burkholderia multivorans TaxID=87883 RepID=UPI001E64DD0D|nr:hypothetical protein [Burkholderia multivorans]
MIDTDKMKALAQTCREQSENAMVGSTLSKAADAIDTLLAALESSKQEANALLSTIAECRDKAHAEGYGESFLYEAIACPDDVPAFIGQTVTELRAALEAAAADKRDAERYRAHIRYEYESLYLPGARKKGLRPLTIKEYKTSADQVADAALSQRQEES